MPIEACCHTGREGFPPAARRASVLVVNLKNTGWKVVVAAVLLPWALLQGCGGGAQQTSSATGSGGGTTFGAGACRSCEKMACGTEISACQAEPECAAYLGCEDACPSAQNGSVDAACAGACSAVTGSTAKAALDAFQSCRSGAACAACGQGSGGAGGGGGGGLCTPPAFLTQTCAPSNEASACIKCQYEKCCDSVDGLFGGGTPTQLKDCWLNCTDTACEKACFDMYPSAVPAFGEYQACANVNCGAAGSCKVSSPCNKCQYEQCSCEYAACMIDAECFLTLSCFAGCNGDPACGQACVAAHPQGKALFDTLAVCTTQKCVQQCGG